MIYKFKSKADGDVIMMAPSGDALLRALGREPSAQGIIEPGAMAAAIAAIERAVADDEAARAARPVDDAGGAGAEPAAGRDGVSLRQRLWPMREMLRRSLDAQVPVVWGA